MPRSLIDKDSPLELISKKFVEKVGLLQSITRTTKTLVLETSHNEFFHLQEFIELQVTWHCIKHINLDLKFHILDHDDLGFDMLLPRERLKGVSQDIIECHKVEPSPELKPHRTFFTRDDGKLIGVHVKHFCSNVI
jgi:hypothetical protein